MNDELKKKVENSIAEILKNYQIQHYFSEGSSVEAKKALKQDLANALEKWCDNHKAFARHRGW